MERLTQILFVLSRSPDRTATTDRLLEHVAYGADKVEDRRRQLLRDIGHLCELGWAISSVGAEGDAGRYRLVAGDLRLRVDFAQDEQTQLQRAARVAQLSGPGQGAAPAPISHLDVVQRAVSAHCLLSFTYKATRRQVHPHQVHVRTGGWYLRAREISEDEVKVFRLDRISDVALAQPGTAEVPPPDAHLRIDPIAWQVDPLLLASVATTAEHVPQVTAMLGQPVESEPEGSPPDGLLPGEVLLRIPVSHRAAFLGRLYELGSRVRLLGPSQLREQVREHLLAVIQGRP